MRAGLTILGALVVVWVVLVAVLWVRSPDRATLTMVARLLPDTMRLVGRLARDRTISRSARWPLWLVLAYLAMPFDLVPDVIPVLGWADDAILVSLVLRRLIHRTDPDVIERHWPGSVEGLDALRQVLRLGPAGAGPRP